MTFGERVAHMMSTLDVRAAEFARIVGVTRANVSIWLTQGDCRIEPKNLFRIETRTGFRARWIALGEAPERVDDMTTVLSAEEELVMQRWRSVAKTSRATGLRLLEALPREDEVPQFSRRTRKVVESAN